MKSNKRYMGPSSAIQAMREQHERMIKSLAYAIPKIDTSALQAMKDAYARARESVAYAVPSVETSAIQAMMEQQERMLKSMAYAIPKIDTSAFADLAKIQKEFQYLKIDEIPALKEIDLSEKNIKKIEILNEKIEQKIIFTPNDWQLYINTIKEVIYLVAAIFTIYAFLFPDDAENIKLQEQIEEMSTNYQQQFQDIQQAIINTQLNDNSYVYYEAVRKVNVRRFPKRSKESKVIDIAPIKQKFLLLNKHSTWIEIEYFNEKKQKTITGWVYKRNTKRLTTDLAGSQCPR